MAADGAGRSCNLDFHAPMLKLCRLCAVFDRIGVEVVQLLVMVRNVQPSTSAGTALSICLDRHEADETVHPATSKLPLAPPPNSFRPLSKPPAGRTQVELERRCFIARRQAWSILRPMQLDGAFGVGAGETIALIAHAVAPSRGSSRPYHASPAYIRDTYSNLLDQLAKPAFSSPRSRCPIIKPCAPRFDRLNDRRAESVATYCTSRADPPF